MKAWLHLDVFTSTDEFALHQFGTVRREDIFVLRFENVVSTNFCIQMESNQDSIALTQQVQALVAIVEELTRQNQEMKLWLQQKENLSKAH